MSKRGRPKGAREIDMGTIRKIVSLSQEGKSRPSIARKLNVSQDTVWRYQKKYEVL